MAWSVLLTTHVLAASAALVLGPFNLLRRRKGDAWHRAVGVAWAAAVYWAALSSFWIREIRPGAFSVIHLLSVLTLVTLTLALVALRRGDVRAHRAHMLGSYLGVVGAFLGAVAVPGREIPRLATGTPLLFAALASAVVVASVALAWALRAVPWPLRRAR